MASEKQILANRNNALASTGPKTPEGKLAVRLNAVRHGLRAQDALLPDEDPHQLQALCDELYQQLEPYGLMEEQLVDRMANVMWRINRVERVEAGVFSFNFHSVLRDRAAADKWGKEELPPHRLRRVGVDYHIAPSPEKKQEAIEREEQAETVTRSELATIGQAFTRGAGGGDVFSKLSRYESWLERSFHKTLHELERLQESRESKSRVLPTS